MAGRLKFSGSQEDYDSSKYAILGVPFDSTTSFRSGQRFAPNRIREASDTLERYIYDLQINLKEARIFDAGDTSMTVSPEEMVKNVEREVSRLIRSSKFPILLGGEHTITIGTLNVLRENDYDIIFLDAHPDFRDSLLGMNISHGTVAKHAVNTLGIENVSAMGLRSISLEEKSDPMFSRYRYITSDELNDKGEDSFIKELFEHLSGRKLYLSIDLDVMDPSIAPGVATPEPFGISSFTVRRIIRKLSPHLIGADIVEYDPPYDNGNTGILAARLVQEIIGAVEASRK